MKYGKKYMFVACAALLLGMQSCDLEEYNPAGSTQIGRASCRERV